MAFKIKKSLPTKQQETTDEDGNVPVEGEVLSEAAAMAQLPGVESVDRVFVASANAFDFLQRYRTPLLGALGAVVAGILVWGGASTLAAKRAYEDSGKVYRALSQNYAPIGNVENAGDFWAQGDPFFASAEARNSARLQSATDAVENTKGGAKTVSQLLLGAALADSGRAADAQAQYDAFRKNANNNLERLLVDFASASVAAQNGDLDGAIAKLDGIASADASLKPATDEQRASLIDAYGSREDALQAWTAVAEAHADSSLGSQAAARVAQLEILIATVAR